MSKSEYVPTIGLEIHAELKTKTKMFCNSKNDADETRPNVNICSVCLAHPGTLPVINREAVRQVLRVGLALKAQLADYTEFDRKNYFYPDLPKGYQLSQFKYPLVSGGELNGVKVTRVHLEEDTASSMHTEDHSASSGQGGETSIDYNRAGVPLMELVTEPVITSAKQAGDLARELQLLLRYLDVSNANMEKGEMRVEANISIGTGGNLGTKVEVKNLNSFRAMERAVEYEIKRQEELLHEGGVVVQETRGWNEAKQETFSQRIKEGNADYRYFPDPDLPPLKLSELGAYAPDILRQTLPELPWERRERYRMLGVRTEDAESFVRDRKLGDFFEQVISGEKGLRWIELASNYIANDLVSMIRDSIQRDTEDKAEIPISALNFKKIIGMVSEKRVSSRAAKDILAAAVTSGGDPEEIAAERGLFQDISGSDLKAVVNRVLTENASVVEDFKAGKLAALQYLIGQSMKAAKGAGDPSVLKELILESIQGR